MTVPEKPWYTSMITEFLLCDVPEFVGIPPAALARDVLTLEHRVATEGESFLTKTLPQLGKSFDFALQERSPLAVSGFKKRTRRSALPAFLQALLRRVFKDDGSIRTEPCIRSITVVRQLCNWCKKIEKGYSDESLQKAIKTFVEVDMALPKISISTDPKLLGLARTVVHLIFRNGRLDGLRPAHGPGAVAWGKGHPKRRLDISFRKLERMFRPIPWFRSYRDASENPREVTARPVCEYGLSRLAFVEKDSSGPRLIGLEPAEYMWCQQALKRWLYDHIERHPITKGRVNFTDQSVNRSLTSEWEKFDTLDMSSASDRNSFSLVRLLFKGLPLWPYLEASRTPGIVLPNGEVLMYEKFAPMGSACCFPVEAIVFFAMAVSSLVKNGYPFLLALKSTFVYGDDLVVPHGFYAAMCRDFESVGLIFSDAKCCISGKFRESCGMDAYNGVDVTPLRLRRPHGFKGISDMASIVEHANALFEKGYVSASKALRRGALAKFPLLRRMSIPFTDEPNLPVLAWKSTRSTVKFFTKDFISYVRGYAYRPKMVSSGVEELRHLRESLSLLGPVGELRLVRGQKVRFFAVPYSGSYFVCNLPYIRNSGESRELVLTNAHALSLSELIERWRRRE